MKIRRRKTSWLRRLVTLFACAVFLIASIAAVFVGITFEVAIGAVLGLGLLIGPAIVERGGLLAVFANIFEVAIDAIFSIFEGIGSIFSG